ncbi:MAG: HNH endonuclease [Clostridia bacterium]|nr:HNH endonuclease [Clostridia bacterium]
MNCINCNKEIKKRSKYCSNKCQKEYQYKTYINKWKNSEINGMRGEYQISSYIKTYLFNKYNNKCARCGWGEINKYTNKIPLEIEHIDGNYKNNKEENLILLCPNCHSLTSTYKGANLNKGRKGRNKYNK